MPKKISVKSENGKGSVPRRTVKKVMKDINTVPWNKKILEVKVFDTDGTIKWDIVISQNDEEKFSVDENAKTAFGLPCLSTGKTIGKALKKFMKKEDSLYKKKMCGLNYSE